MGAEERVLAGDLLLGDISGIDFRAAPQLVLDRLQERARQVRGRLGLADVLTDWDTAEEHFEDALRMNRDMEAWPWLAHTQHRFARMLRRRGRTGDIKRIEELLSQSWTTASQLGMIALKESLRRDQH